MAGLLDALRQYIADALPGGSLNPEQPAKLSGLLDAGKKQAQYIGGLLDPNSPISQDAQNWHKKTQIGLADQLAGRQTPEAEQAYQTMMQAAGIAPVGMIAWHGSPHKFDKFDLSKIGTGEGAQAYGHGLYLAENPKVAQEYSKLNPTATVAPNRIFQGVELVPGSPEYHAGTLLERSTLPAARKEVAGWIADGHPDPKVLDGWKKTLETLNKATKKSDFKVGKNENLYKTDIPDEAVARFLDWDKKLSEQSPEIQKAWDKFVNSKAGRSADKSLNGALSRKEGQFADPTGKDLYSTLSEGLIGVGKPRPFLQVKEEATNQLARQGIPGIRYLDGGSRGTGTGTSNFVAFDPEMIRILERNGIPTGLQPWKPGEWK